MKMILYNKPQIREVKLAANQAIAACGTRILGYQNEWSQSGSATGYPTREEAVNAHNTLRDDIVYPIVRVDGYDTVEGEIYGTWHDRNGNSILDGAEVISNQKGSNAVVEALCRTNSAVITS